MAQFELGGSGSSTKADELFIDESATLADGAELDSGWLDMEEVDKYQFNAKVSAAGLNQRLESAPSVAGQASPLVTNTTTVSTFTFFNVAPRERYMRFRLQNDTGAPVTDASLTIKATYGSSDKLSVFPLNVDPSDFSQAALVQAVTRAINPNGDYVNTAASGKDDGNSSVDNLLASTTYTGDYQDVRGQQSAVILVLSDQELDTVRLQWSTDGTNANTTLLSVSDFTGSVQVLSGFYIYLEIVSLMIDNYVRVEVTNGIVDTNVFEVDTWFSPTNYGGAYLPPTAPFTSLTSGLATRSLIVGQQPDGDYVNAPADGAAFENSTLLTASQTFTSGWHDTDGFKEIEVYVATDQVSASSGISIEYTDDAQAVTPTVYPGPEFTFDAGDVANGFKIVAIRTALDGFRVTYTNGGVDQTSFYISTTLKTNASTLTQLGLATDLDSSTQAVINRSGIYAENDSNQFGNITRAASGGLRVAVNEFETGVPIAALGNFTTNQANVGTTAVQIVGSPLTGRKTVLVKNLSDSTKVVYIGNNSSVTSSSGYELATGEGIEIDMTENGDAIWAISASGTQRVCWFEIGD